MEQGNRGNRGDREAWPAAPRGAVRALLLAFALVGVATPVAGQTERPADFADCERKPITIPDFPESTEALLTEAGGAAAARLEKVLQRIRKSFAGCGRTPGYDWIEVRGYAAEGDGDAEGASQRRAAAAREVLRRRLGEPFSDDVHFEVAIGRGAADPVAPSNREAARAKNRRVEIHLCWTFGPFHDNLETIEASHFAPYAARGDPFDLGEMKSLRDQLLAWSAEPSRPTSPFSRINGRFWRRNGACTGETLLRRLERVRQDFYDFHIRPHEYELSRLREGGATPAEIRRLRECAAARDLLEDAEVTPSMARIFRERLRERFAVCHP